MLATAEPREGRSGSGARRRDAIVCGAGAAGLASAATLKEVGLGVAVLERSGSVGSSWRSRYDGLRLNTPAWMSTLPGFRARHSRYGEYPTREQWVRYLEDYAAHHDLEVDFGTEMRRIDRTDGGWRIETDRGPFAAPIAVIATGHDHEPQLPDWPGRDSFEGELLHASSYRNPGPYRRRDVLVVGPNVTGTEISNQLARGGARRVQLSSRTPPNLTRRKFMGITVNVPGIVLNRLPTPLADEIGWLTQLIMFGRLDRYGLPRSPTGIASNMARLRSPAYDDGFVDQLKAGRIEIVPEVVSLSGAEAVLADGRCLRPDAVIAATGYRRGLEPIVGHLGVLDEHGAPLVNGGEEHGSAPGLFFNGYRGDLSGQLRLMRLGARAISRSARDRISASTATGVPVAG